MNGASQGKSPAMMPQIMEQMTQAIQTVNAITSNHNINVNLDINNIISRQIADRMKSKSAVDTAMRNVYGQPQQSTFAPIVTPPVQAAAAKQISFDDIGVE